MSKAEKKITMTCNCGANPKFANYAFYCDSCQIAAEQGPNIYGASSSWDQLVRNRRMSRVKTAAAFALGFLVGSSRWLWIGWLE